MQPFPMDARTSVEQLSDKGSVVHVRLAGDMAGLNHRRQANAGGPGDHQTRAAELRLLLSLTRPIIGCLHLELIVQLLEGAEGRGIRAK